MLLNGSWRLLENLLETFQPQKSILNPSWAVLQEFQDRFQDFEVQIIGVGGSRVEPVGGDIGESIPKGIDAGLCEPLRTK